MKEEIKKFIPKPKKWTKEDDAFLIENHGKLKNVEIAKNLNKTIWSIKSRIYILELSKITVQTPLYEIEKKVITNLKKRGFKGPFIADILEISVDRVYRLINKK